MCAFLPRNNPPNPEDPAQKVIQSRHRESLRTTLLGMLLPPPWMTSDHRQPPSMPRTVGFTPSTPPRLCAACFCQLRGKWSKVHLRTLLPVSSQSNTGISKRSKPRRRQEIVDHSSVFWVFWQFWPPGLKKCHRTCANCAAQRCVRNAHKHALRRLLPWVLNRSSTLLTPRTTVRNVGNCLNALGPTGRPWHILHIPHILQQQRDTLFGTHSSGHTLRRVAHPWACTAAMCRFPTFCHGRRMPGC